MFIYFAIEMMCKISYIENYSNLFAPIVFVMSQTKALEFINAAVEHTPTLVDVFQVRTYFSCIPLCVYLYMYVYICV
jgi:hypothetical protein